MPTSVKLANPLKFKNQADIDNPYPAMKLLRETEPVWWCKDTKTWIVSTYAETQSVFRSPDFEKQIHRWKHMPNTTLLEYFPQFRALLETTRNWMLNLNPPDHTRVRNLVGRAFAPSTVQALRPEIERIAIDLIENTRRKNLNEPIEFIDAYAFQLPIAVIGLILGVPVSESRQLKEWSHQMVAIIGGNRRLDKLMSSGAAIVELRKYLKPIIEERRANPKDDLLSLMLKAEEEGSKLSTLELLGNLILLIVAGHETTSNLIANSMLCLLRNQEQLALLREQPDLINQTVTEVLRYESPAQAVPRLANKETQVGDKTVAEGDMVWMLVGSANRDAKHFSEPEKFDITRSGEHNIAFGEGIHRCIGASLAEIETQVALTCLLDNFSHIEMADRPITFKKPFALRAMESLYISIR